MAYMLRGDILLLGLLLKQYYGFLGALGGTPRKANSEAVWLYFMPNQKPMNNPW